MWKTRAESRKLYFFQKMESNIKCGIIWVSYASESSQARIRRENKLARARSVAVCAESDNPVVKNEKVLPVFDKEL